MIGNNPKTTVQKLDNVFGIYKRQGQQWSREFAMGDNAMKTQSINYLTKQGEKSEKCLMRQ